MASPFEAAMAAADTAITAIMGEAIQIHPMVQSQYKGAIPDPDRPVVSVQAVFTLTPESDRLKGMKTGAEIEGFAALQVADAELWICAEVVKSLPYRPRADDRIVLAEKPGTSSYSIVRPKPSDLGDLKFALVVENAP